MLVKLLKNGPLATLVYLLVLVVGLVSYQLLPRQQDPTVNLNYLGVSTIFPGATAEDVERRITIPLERAISRVADVKFTRSTSRENLSDIILRFNEMPEDTFAARIQDARREVQNALRDLPPGIDPPKVTTLSTANLFPSAKVVIHAREEGEALRRYAHQSRQDLERLSGVERVNVVGERNPELQVLFHPEKLAGLGVSPTYLADTITTYYRDLSAGDLTLGDQKWQVRFGGTTEDPVALERLPILSTQGEVPLRSVADVVTGMEDAREVVRYQGQPAVLLSVMKSTGSNLLELIEEIQSYINDRNQFADVTGVRLVLVDDTTYPVRKSLHIMESNALIGLLLVLFVTWLFLGVRSSVLIGIALPFILAGTFAALLVFGQTLNVIVLLGIVICLGMLVDDSVVVIESIHFHARRGLETLPATLKAIRETFAPVLSSSLTTMAAFLPLMLLPGVLGEFMRTIPMVVLVALSFSLVECFWMLPAHAITVGSVDDNRASPGHRLRRRGLRLVRSAYARALIGAMRRPWLSLGAVVSLSLAVSLALTLGVIRTEFFASDPFRLLYVSVQMPAGTTLDKTMDVVGRVEGLVKSQLRPDEMRHVVTYAGQRFTDQDPAIGDEHGQVFVSLNPLGPLDRKVDEIIDDLRGSIDKVAGPERVTFLKRKTGPPVLKPISLKVRGDDSAAIRQVADRLSRFLEQLPAVSDVADDDVRGARTLAVSLDADAALRSGVPPEEVVRSLRLFLDGEVASSTEYRGEKIDVRVRAVSQPINGLDDFLRTTISLREGGEIALSRLLIYQTEPSKAEIRHHNLRRSITVEADLDKREMDTPEALRLVRQEWTRIAPEYPGVDLDFSGEMDDIENSIQALGMMFVFGIGLVYLILGAQFRSYLQPLLVVSTVPIAFVGVLLGLLVTQNPLSIYTLYGVVALAGIAVNGAIVLISGANAAVNAGIPVQRAAFFAARRRVVPILITTLTTMAGLASLAMGWGGESLMWGPIATAIVWGLGFSTLLGLLVLPVLYSVLVRDKPPGEIILPVPQPVGTDGNGQGSRWGRRFLAALSMAKPEPGLETIAGNPDLSRTYDQGCQFLATGDYEQAIRRFEKVADAAPDNPMANLSAAQALIMLMQHRLGWDIGYDARAKRFLDRVSREDRENPRLRLLQQAARTLKHSTKKEADG